MSEQIITRTKDDAVTLRWLQQATSKDASRAILSGVHKANGRAVGCDGFRLHIAPTPQALQDLEDDTVLKIRNGRTLHKTPGRVYPTEQIEGTFPDWESIVPKDDPSLVIAFNPQYLRDAIELPQPAGSADMVVLKLYNSSHPIIVQDVNGTHQAVVMPMYLGDKHTAAADQARSCDKRLHQKTLDHRTREIVDWIKYNHPDVYNEAREHT